MFSLSRCPCCVVFPAIILYGCAHLCGCFTCPGDHVRVFLQHLQDVQVGRLQDNKKPAHGVHSPEQRLAQAGGARGVFGCFLLLVVFLLLVLSWWSSCFCLNSGWYIDHTDHDLTIYSISNSSSPAAMRGCTGSVLYRSPQEAGATVDHADYAGLTRQQELDHTRLGMYDLSALEDLDHELWE